MSGRALETLDLLLENRPVLHQSAAGEAVNYRINDQVLVWLANNLQPGQHTLETGCGYSTIMFMASETQHTSIAPAAVEFERIQDWCTKNGIPVNNTSFIIRPSEMVLPTLELNHLDVVLIDGQHAFPYPVLDWFHTVHRLKVGGHLILDDIHMRAVNVVHKFLMREVGRWKHCDTIGNTSVFEKLVDDPLSGFSWRQQPWGARPVVTLRQWAHGLVVAPSIRLVKRSDRLTNWLRPFYRKHVVKRQRRSN